MKLTLRIFQWLIILPLHILAILARYPLAPLAVVLFSSKDKRTLRHPFHWLQTDDADLSGDSGWKKEHLKPGVDPLSTWNRIRWLWRNGAQSFNYRVIGCRDNMPWRQSSKLLRGKQSFWHRPDGYWLWRSFTPLFGRYLEVFIGWGLFGHVLDRCKFVCTIRLAKTNKS